MDRYTVPKLTDDENLALSELFAKHPRLVSFFNELLLAAQMGPPRDQLAEILERTWARHRCPRGSA